MSDYEVAELTWENGQLAMHGLGGLLLTAQTKPTWNRVHDTLESIVQQATCGYQKSNFNGQEHTPSRIGSTVASSSGKWVENSGQVQMVPTLTRKRTRSDSDHCGRNFSSGINVLEYFDPSACASASATFCRDNDTSMTWASLDSGQSLKNKTFEEDSACHCGSENPGNQNEDKDIKVELGCSNSTRRNKAASIHNQSERRRRNRINERMKTLQKLVPNASKTDKASMLDKVIEYLKQLQAQVQMMSMRNMPQIMMPLAMPMQQLLQMPMLARMSAGLGLGMGMLNMNATGARSAPQSLSQIIQHTPFGASTTAPTFVAPYFMMPPLIQAHTHAPAPPKPDPASAGTNASVPLPDPFSTMLAQSTNMDLLNNMAAIYRQQISQNNQGMSSQSQPHQGQGVEKKCNTSI